MDSIIKKHYNIALVVGNIEDDFPNAICKGAVMAAEELGDNLFIIPVKYLDFFVADDPHQAYEYQYNTLLSYAHAESLDLVLLCLSNIGSTTTRERCMEVLQDFKEVPLILIASNEEGYSSVRYANDIGLADGITHLIEEEDRKTIAMIPGHPDNPDSMERLAAYKTVLSEHGLPIEESLIQYSQLDGNCAEAVERLLAHSPQPDAIVCGNDSIAFTVYDVLAHHGISIGSQISVIGFDDLEASKHLSPPLATVRASAHELGQRAVMQGHRKLQAGTTKIPESFLVNTQFIFRESIGTHARQQVLLQRQRDEQDWFLEKAELSDTSRQLIDMNHHMNILSRDMLMLDDNEDASYQRVLNCLAQASIRNCYLFLLKEPTPYHWEDTWETPRHMYLRAFLRDGNVTIPSRSEQRMSTQKLYRNIFMPTERNTFVAVDLYSRETQYGFMLCDINFHNYHYVEFLCYQISIALRLIHMLADKKALLAEKDDLVSRLQVENLQLDAISAKDELTGILNRRGFYKKTADYIEKVKKSGSPMLFAYADLNFLKQINDHFGHGEGDFALQICAQALEEVFPDGIVGRIGGDEFAALTVCNTGISESKLRNEINSRLAALSSAAGKPYAVRLSIGTYLSTQDSAFQLNKAVEIADAYLYEDKKKKPPFES